MSDKNDGGAVDLAPLTKSIGDLKGVVDTDLKNLKDDVADLKKQVSISTKDNELDDPMLGIFKSAGDFWLAGMSYMGAKNGYSRDVAKNMLFGDGGYVSRVNAILEKSSTGFNEATDSDGGLFIMPQLGPGLMKLEAQLADFEGKAMSFPVSGITYSLNALVDKNHSTSVAGGVTVSRKAEGVSPDKSKAAFEQISWKVSKQTGYTDLTEELMADAPAVASLIPELFARAFKSAGESDFLYNGGGAGEPLAALHSGNPSLVTISKESGQTADTIVIENLLKMRARCWDYANAFWFATQDIIPEVATIVLGDSPIFLPSGTQDVPDRILGRPVIYTEHASALGDLNDIALVAPKHYGIANRLGIQQQSSIHVRFLQGETTLRFIRRNDGQPLWKSALTPINGNTKSPFVNLEAR